MTREQPRWIGRRALSLLAVIPEDGWITVDDLRERAAGIPGCTKTPDRIGGLRTLRTHGAIKHRIMGERTLLTRTPKGTTILDEHTKRMRPHTTTPEGPRP